MRFTFTRSGSVRSMFGWTPGLRAILRSRVLQCGCTTGTYETFTSELAEIVDATAPGCRTAGHAEHAVLWHRPAHALVAGYAFDEPVSLPRGL
jgi:hypothetical protein